jgi:hypothetical protein
MSERLSSLTDRDAWSDCVIDMRCRPAYLHDFFGATPGSAGNETAKWLNQRVGTRGNLEHYAASRTADGFLHEVRAAKLRHAVVVGRHTPAQYLPNDLIHRIVHGHDELIGIGAVDPVLQGEPAALAEVERAVKSLGLAGIDLESGFGEPARFADDPVYWLYPDLPTHKWKNDESSSSSAGVSECA